MSNLCRAVFICVLAGLFASSLRATTSMAAAKPDLVLISLSSGMRGYCSEISDCGLGDVLAWLAKSLGRQAEVVGFFYLRESVANLPTQTTLFVPLGGGERVRTRLRPILRGELENLRQTTPTNREIALICSQRYADLAAPLEALAAGRFPAKGSRGLATPEVTPGRGLADFHDVYLLTDNRAEPMAAAGNYDTSGLVASLRKLEPLHPWLYQIDRVPFWGRVGLKRERLTALATRVLPSETIPRLCETPIEPELASRIERYRCAKFDGAPASVDDCRLATSPLPPDVVPTVLQVEQSGARSADNQSNSLLVYVAREATLALYALTRAEEPAHVAEFELIRRIRGRRALPLAPPPSGLVRRQIRLKEVRAELSSDGTVRLMPLVTVRDELLQWYGVTTAELQFGTRFLNLPSSTSMDVRSMTWRESVTLRDGTTTLGSGAGQDPPFRFALALHESWADWFASVIPALTIGVNLEAARLGESALELPAAETAPSELVADLDLGHCFQCRGVVEAAWDPRAPRPAVRLADDQSTTVDASHLRGAATGLFYKDLRRRSWIAIGVAALALYLAVAFAISGQLYLAARRRAASRGWSSLTCGVLPALSVSPTLWAHYAETYHDDTLVWATAAAAALVALAGVPLALGMRYSLVSALNRHVPVPLAEPPQTPDVLAHVVEPAPNAPPPLRLSWSEEKQDAVPARWAVRITGCDKKDADAALGAWLRHRRCAPSYAAERDAFVHACAHPDLATCHAFGRVVAVFSGNEQFVDLVDDTLRCGGEPHWPAIVASVGEAARNAAEVQWWMIQRSTTALGPVAMRTRPLVIEHHPGAPSANLVLGALCGQRLRNLLERTAAPRTTPTLDFTGESGAWLYDLAERLPTRIDSSLANLAAAESSAFRGDCCCWLRGRVDLPVADPFVVSGAALHRVLAMWTASGVERHRVAHARLAANELRTEIEAVRGELKRLAWRSPDWECWFVV